MDEWTSQVRSTQKPIYWPHRTTLCCKATQHQQHLSTQFGMLTYYINRLSVFVITVL